MIELHTLCAVFEALNVDADEDVMDREEDEEALAGDLRYSKEVRGVEAEEVDIFRQMRGCAMCEQSKRILELVSSVRLAKELMDVCVVVQT